LGAAIRAIWRIPVEAGGVVLVLAALALGGCGPKTSPGEPPVIVTESVPSAMVGAAYVGQLSSEGGVAPLSWSLESPARPLSWLALDVNGRLSGTPSEVVFPAARFLVTLSDAAGRSDTRDLAIEVRACDDGTVRACGVSEGNACLVGSQRCEGGRFLACSGGTPSLELEHCGPDCNGCGERADECRDGRCRCGGGGACESAAAPSCCGGDCVDRQSDLDHCGECGQSCLDRDGDGVVDAPSGTNPVCAGGSCTYACAPGHARCDPNSESCVSVMDDVQRCGQCNTQCNANLPNTQNPTCQDGVCGAVCLNGFADCNGDVQRDGCEINLRSDAANCGACGNVCNRPNRVNACELGQCSLACKPGWADLTPIQEGQPDDGCETSLNTVLNCGAVGNVCGNGANATPICVNGVCGLTCQAGYGNCDGALGNGCEVRLSSSPNHCGSCGNACSQGMSCVNSQCCEMEHLPGQPPRCL